MKGRRFIWSFLFLVAAFQCVVTECPDDWVKQSGSCYLVVTRYPLQWINAMSFCKLYGATLAEVGSAAEDRFIQDLARPQGDLFWLGGSDVVVEGNWKWMGSHVGFSYSAWAPGEPSNTFVGGEHCLQLKANEIYHWNDAVCSSKLSFICENVDPHVRDILVG